MPGDLLGVGLLGLASMTGMAKWSVRAEVWGMMLLTIGQGSHCWGDQSEVPKD